jgi:hypothetical protein
MRKQSPRVVSALVKPEAPHEYTEFGVAAPQEADGG